MKKKRRILSMLLAMILCVTTAVPTMAASANYTKANNAYKKWIKNHSNQGGFSQYYDIVDLDGNGIPELMLSMYNWNNAVYTYDVTNNKIIKLKGNSLGKYVGNGVAYNKSRKIFSLVTENTGGYTYWFYKLNGKKVTKVSTYTYRNRRSTTDGSQSQYLINGKLCGETTFRTKLKAAQKGYVSLRYTF